MEEKKKRRWVQDSERKKFQVSKENFFPVPLGRNRKEIATQWFQELAGSKSFSQLAKKVSWGGVSLWEGESKEELGLTLS